MKYINPTITNSWKNLQKHFKNTKHITLYNLFSNDNIRFSKFSIFFKDQILIDFSKNHITEKTLNLLFNLAEEINLKQSIYAMFHGEKINYTENRPVLHVALRNFNQKPIIIDGKNITFKINSVLKKIKVFSENIIYGKWKGYTGKSIKNIVNIGIGGSHLGPLMVTEALRPYKNHLKIHFVSNIDGTDISETLKNLNPENTLFIIVSKTFSTIETISNAKSARKWFLKNTNSTKIEKHFVAVSTNIKKVKEFGINNVFEFWDWVGGRYSLWSSVGLSIILSIGYENFKSLLYGAYEMDQHFLNTKIEKNIPILLGLISIWYSNFFKTETEAILPYDQYMHKFPSYLQQSCMESNGKYIDRNGEKINYQTGSIIWGEPGTNGQHSFYQLLHQGTKLVPCDFIAPAISHNPIGKHHNKLLSNFFAQTEALAFGSSNILNNKYLYKKDISNFEKYLIKFKYFEGNRPSNSIFLKKIDPFTLGALIALYEHKIFTQGIILNIFSFDQWGVELGKRLANSIYYELENDKKIHSYDSSTNNLINIYKKWRKNK